MLEVKNISKSLGSFEIEDVSFEVQQGQYFVLLGVSGAGKSVILKSIAGLINPDNGRVTLEEKNITNQSIQKRNVGLVFQNNTLFPHMTVYDNIAYSLKCKKFKSHQIRQRVEKLAEELEIANLLKRRCLKLSGGEIQRVCLARVLASEPGCLLLDEPLSALDAKARPQMRALLRKLNRNGQTIIHVTHDYTEAVSLATHIAVMENGKIAQTGTIEQIFQHPKSEFVARFIGIRNFFKGKLEKTNNSETNLKRFVTNGCDFSILAESDNGQGCIMIRSEDITISNSKIDTSARNNFEGTITDIIRMKSGFELIIDIGLELAAIVTAESVKSMSLDCGKKIWVSFKASAVKYIG